MDNVAFVFAFGQCKCTLMVVHAEPTQKRTISSVAAIAIVRTLISDVAFMFSMAFGKRFVNDRLQKRAYCAHEILTVIPVFTK